MTNLLGESFNISEDDNPFHRLFRSSLRHGLREKFRESVTLPLNNSLNSSISASLNSVQSPAGGHTYDTLHILANTWAWESYYG